MTLLNMATISTIKLTVKNNNGQENRMKHAVRINLIGLAGLEK
jgi:hypothetical protein